MSGINHLPRSEQFLGFDFSPYSEQGFLFTPESFIGEYESVGLVNYTITPEANFVKVSGSGISPTMSSEIYKWQFEDVDINDAIKGMYDRCVEMGADALVRFKVEVNESYIPTTTQPINQYIVSGFAIKRK